MSIDPNVWEREWFLLPFRVTQQITSEPVTGWFNGRTAPERIGFYDRMFTDGTFRHWWDGALWRVSPQHPEPHWRQVGDYPVWRGLRRAAAAISNSAVPL